MGCPPRVLVGLGFGFTVVNVSLATVVLAGSWLFCLILVADLSDLFVCFVFLFVIVFCFCCVLFCSELGWLHMWPFCSGLVCKPVRVRFFKPKGLFGYYRFELIPRSGFKCLLVKLVILVLMRLSL